MQDILKTSPSSIKNPQQIFQLCLTITKNPINDLSKFNFERPFYVTFVNVMLNWKIWYGFLIVDGLVFDKIRQSDMEESCMYIQKYSELKKYIYKSADDLALCQFFFS